MRTGRTGNQQHELDNRAEPSGSAPDAQCKRRATRLLSPGLGLGLGLGALSPEEGQLWHDMLELWSGK